MDDHRGLAQPLGARRTHEVGAQHFQHRGARQPRDRPDQHEAERGGGQDQARQATVPYRPGAPGERQQRPFEPDILDQDQADEEHRHRDAGHRAGHDDAIAEAAAIDRCQRPQRKAARHRDQHRPQHQLDGRTDGHRQLLAHHPVGNDRAAEIAAQHAQNVFEELHRDRTVEAEFEANRGDGLGLGVGPGDDHRGIRRHHLQQTKTEEENPEQGGERNQQTMDNLLSHATPTDRLGQWGIAPSLTPTLCSPLPGSRASSDVRGF